MSQVGVVVLTHNGQDYIEACLASVLKNTHKNFKVVVVDNNSSDNTRSIIRNKFPNVMLIRNKSNKGFATASNRGTRLCFEKWNCDYVMLLNDDTVVEKNLISSLVKPFTQYDDIGFTGPIMTYYDEPGRIWFGGGYFNKIFCYTRHRFMNSLLKDTNAHNGYTDFITACCVMISKKIIKDVGYMEEKGYWHYFVDLFYCIEAEKYGHRSYLVAKPLVRHRVSTTLGKGGTNIMNPTRAYFFARNPFLYINHHVTGPRKMTNIAGQFTIRLPFYMTHILKRRDFQSARAYIKGFIEGFRLVV
ncbi:hypothetical protein A2862_04040 [Candidatus Roizmanbacteria bacterium RIFCSPHIGHO2_01_FULL_38_41]|uniref:Glycosyltransferase 2-like domain-containing protein n=1 Tax=Candidatus Roizmanbacteria bacterium RIFCSPHIGHO2_02_FULL_37_24 TaxID=1802037 RepID=A0A1F7GXB8_9BACT|nr:MAG: hypothetical protein A2862_04040 [Candidatus Roizmanbacteria bacterium RIFCSPHIGHO2_01_FULL_38_41]OGK23132.1 MAG: hypothetical protein A3C24_01440 [Candidatus Roizmanbacteria bacterium RIFCSPHIGHO2_02_FULL_37_24]OGK32855.1 MAG: hypothetical protein A3E10_00100 [Candidatus Roizmanbacteria bacterium RIFCSPHIGHO2_12_FULL_37_23]OGK45468.1 MAG: hypothetical protein A2956_00060 [Candidatus Roizmanbacteria bacterium RIFCSPLOWO2_01_FULL_37_57]OGK61113.1 MAG: hypothetical protein A3G65_01085 [Ca